MSSTPAPNIRSRPPGAGLDTTRGSRGLTSKAARCQSQTDSHDRAQLDRPSSPEIPDASWSWSFPVVPRASPASKAFRLTCDGRCFLMRDGTPRPACDSVGVAPCNCKGTAASLMADQLRTWHVALTRHRCAATIDAPDNLRPPALAGGPAAACIRDRQVAHRFRTYSSHSMWPLSSRHWICAIALRTESRM